MPENIDSDLFLEWFENQTSILEIEEAVQAPPTGFPHELLELLGDKTSWTRSEVQDLLRQLYEFVEPIFIQQGCRRGQNEILGSFYQFYMEKAFPS